MSTPLLLLQRKGVSGCMFDLRDTMCDLWVAPVPPPPLSLCLGSAVMASTFPHP